MIFITICSITSTSISAEEFIEPTPNFNTNAYSLAEDELTTAPTKPETEPPIDDPGSCRLTITAGPGGSVSPAGDKVYVSSSGIILTATPNEGYEVDLWTHNSPGHGYLTGKLTQFEANNHNIMEYQTIGYHEGIRTVNVTFRPIGSTPTPTAPTPPAPSPGEGWQETFRRGDILTDNSVDMKDVVMLQMLIAEIPTSLNSIQPILADVTDDKVIDMKDIVMIQKRVAQILSDEQWPHVTITFLGHRFNIIIDYPTPPAKIT